MAANILTVRIGGQTIRENLDQAIRNGQLLEHEDGTFQLARDARMSASSPWWHYRKKGQSPLACLFLGEMIFKCAYARSAVPYGCRNCYKVKVVLHTLRELMALMSILDQFDCRSKCGVELGYPYSHTIYSGFFYGESLEQTREIYHAVRERVDATPHLGPHLAMFIRRGCSLFEVCCGPSDQYTFHEALPEVENYLRNHYRVPVPSLRLNKTLIMAEWIKTAYNIGDTTYLDFTGGKPLFPKAVTYPVLDPQPKDDR